MRAGDLVDDRFELEGLAGVGGTSSVYRARDLTSSQRVALKFLNADSWPMVQRFVREASILSDLHHPGIVRYVAHGIADGGVPYLAMEWLEGENVSQALAGRDKFSVPEALRLVRRVAEAVAVAHARGIIHRDLKPSNLFLVDSQIDAVKVLDFGLARGAANLPAATKTGSVVGTPGYMAPEQARGDDVVAAPADVFSLGCVLYECLTGRPAFAGQHLTAILTKILVEPAPRVRQSCPELPPELDDLVQRMLSKDPERRPADARALLGELSELLQEHSADRALGSSPAASLTRREQALLSVLMIRDRRSRARRLPALATGHNSEEAQRLRAIAARHGGKLEFLGNGTVVVVFEPDAAATDLASQAALCALGMHSVLPKLPMALATGPGLVKGVVPIGEVIDRAATLLDSQALTSLAAGTQTPPAAASTIRVDRATAGLLQARFQLMLSSSGEGYLLSAKEQPDTGRMLLGKPTRCVGRERELSMLEGLLRECVSEPGARGALIMAPAGAGKSRLRYEFTRILSASPQRVSIWQAWGDPTRAGSPFGLLAQAVRGALGIVEGEPASVSRLKVQQRVESSVGTRSQTRVMEFLGELVGVQLSEQDSMQLRAARRDPRFMGDQIAQAWEDWLAAECEQAPVLLVLEDLHWGDWTTLKLVDSALRNLEASPFFVLALARPEVQDMFPGLWKDRPVEEVRLRALPKHACEELVRSVLGSQGSDTLVDRVVERAGGNAFYLEELIRAAAEGNPEELPATVLAMVQARFGRLAPEARQVLRAASIFGQSFWEGGVEALAGAAQGTLVRELMQELVDREWVRARRESKLAAETEYTFRHALIRDAAYATLTDEDRTLGHRLAAEWLQRAGERDPVALAEHYQRGGEAGSALACYVRAAEQAFGGDDLVAALAHADRAAACGASGETLGRVRLIQAEAHNWRGEYTRAVQCGTEALRCLEPHTASPEIAERWAHAAHQVIWASALIGNVEEVERLTHLLLTNAPEKPAELWVMALAIATGHAIDVGRMALAKKGLEWLERHGQPLAEKDPITAGVIKSTYAGFEVARYNVAAALRLHEAASQDFQRAGHQRWHSVARICVGALRLSLGDYEHAESALRVALTVGTRIGIAPTVPRVNLALALARQQRTEQAEELFQVALDEFQAQQDHRGAAFTHICLARLYLDRAEYARAEAQARVAASERDVPASLRAYAVGILAAALLAERRVTDALRAASEAFQLLDVPSGLHDHGDAFVRLVYAEALFAAGQEAHASAALSSARERLMDRAARVDDPELRESFLSRVPENARILQLAEEWELGARRVAKS
ncbi:MAG TPA: protein kinase [Polyangiaceae bacterium]